MVLYPNGAYASDYYEENWFLGYKSSFQYIFFPLLYLALVFNHYKKKKGTLLLVSLLIHAETILSWNAMFLVVLVLLDIILFLNLIKYNKIFNIKNYMLSIVIANVSFIFFFLIMLDNPLFSFIIEDLLGKDQSLVSRLTMWAMAVKYISINPVVGLGYIGAEEIARMSGIEQPHVHNQWLMLLLTGGIVGTSIFCMFLWCVFGRIKKQFDLYISRITALILWGLFLAVVVEVFVSAQAMCIWPIFLMGYNAPTFHKQLVACYFKKRHC